MLEGHGVAGPVRQLGDANRSTVVPGPVLLTVGATLSPIMTDVDLVAAAKTEATCIPGSRRS